MSTLDQSAKVVACGHLSVFKASGADARTFLQSQLTQDVKTLSAEHASLAGFCTAQGRLWASMLLTQGATEDEIIGVVSADLAESFLKRLRMFVLRSKVVIDIDPSIRVYGVLVGSQDAQGLSVHAQGKLGDQHWQCAALPSGTWVRMPTADSAAARFLWLANQVQHDHLQSNLSLQVPPQDHEDVWRVEDVLAGLAWVEAQTQDLFIAQTLNLDLVGGVSFTKGCYPGQEVIARAHYRGVVKRRMHLARVTGLNPQLRAGADVFESNEPDNPVGRLINVASDGRDMWVLFEAPFKTLEGEPLRAGASDGPTLTLVPLPYSLKPE
jgi:folate-binding protein YgfZ